MNDRKYSEEIAELIEKKTRDVEGYVARDVARGLVEELREGDPDLLAGYLNEQAENLIYEVIRSMDRSSRARARLTSGRDAFRSAAQAAAEGNSEPLEMFLSLRFVVDEACTRKRLGDMRHDDLVFVGADYRRRAENNALHARVFELIAERVQDGCVSDHYTDLQLAEMFKPLA